LQETRQFADTAKVHTNLWTLHFTL